jgi:hypothetical protein
MTGTENNLAGRDLVVVGRGERRGRELLSEAREARILPCSLDKVPRIG